MPHLVLSILNVAVAVTSASVTVTFAGKVTLVVLSFKVRLPLIWCVAVLSPCKASHLVTSNFDNGYLAASKKSGLNKWPTKSFFLASLISELSKLPILISKLPAVIFPSATLNEPLLILKVPSCLWPTPKPSQPTWLVAVSTAKLLEPSVH